MARLVLQGDNDSPAEGEKIVYDIWNGRIRERKMLGRKVIEWSAFTKEESLQIMAFFGKAIKKL